MRIVLCNCSPGESAALARTLVEERLAACVNVLPGVQSTYRWNGAIHTDEEATLLIKTSGDRLEALRERVIALHSYELPEFVVLEPGEGSHEPYLRWVADSVR